MGRLIAIKSSKPGVEPDAFASGASDSEVNPVASSGSGFTSAGTSSRNLISMTTWVPGIQVIDLFAVGWSTQRKRDGIIIAGMRVPGMETCMVMYEPAMSLLGIAADMKDSQTSS